MQLEPVDQLLLEIIWSKIISALDEGATALMRSAFSPILREANDFACVLTDTQGQLIAQSGLSLPSFLNTIPVTIQHFLKKFGPHSLADGDVLITNDPWLATGHLSDCTLAMPIFRNGRLVAIAGSCGHVSDIGGRQRSTDSRELYEEGLQIPPVFLRRVGRGIELVERFIRENVRTADEVSGDLAALVASLDVIRRRIEELMEDYRLAELDSVASRMQQITENAMREAIAATPDGEYRGTAAMDGDEHQLQINCLMRVSGSNILIDYEGSSPRQPKGINSVYNYTYAYTVYPLKCVLDPLTRNNAGSLRPINVRAPADSILNPRKPAPVGGRSVTGHLLHEAIFQCLVQAVPERAQASSYGPGWAVGLTGRWDDGRPFAVNYVFTGGQGGSSRQDGISCVRFPSNVCNTPVEVIENTVPARIERKILLPDSGGQGTFRGGLGQQVAIRVTCSEPVTVSLLADRTKAGAAGVLGGEPGRRGFCRLNGEAINPKKTFTMRSGDELILDVPGGGGYGPPIKRSQSALQRDLREGYVSTSNKVEVEINQPTST